MGNQEEDVIKDIKEKYGFIYAMYLKGTNEKKNTANNNGYTSSSSHIGINNSGYNLLNSSQNYHQCNIFNLTKSLIMYINRCIVFKY